MVEHQDLDEKMASILVVEDDMFQRFALVETLEDCEYNVVSAEDGMEALKEMYNKKNEFDLVLLDLNMPKMNGYQVL